MSKRNEWLVMPPEELLKECVQEFRKARGHGGQKVNKTSSAVRLTHRETGLDVTADASRSQKENRLHAVSKLRQRMALELREEFSPDNGFELLPEPSLRNPKRLLWEAVVLDCLSSVGWEPKAAALLLNVPLSRLTRILHQSPDLWQILNRSREKAGLHPWKGN